MYLTDKEDYKFTAPLNITIPAGSTTATFGDVTICDDNIVEEDETFCLLINILSDECSSFKADPPHATIIIVDEGTYYICMYVLIRTVCICYRVCILYLHTR